VAARDGIGLEEEFQRARNSLAIGDELGWDTLLKNNREVLGLVWSIERVDSQLPHIIWRRIIRIFQVSCFIRAVRKAMQLVRYERRIGQRYPYFSSMDHGFDLVLLTGIPDAAAYSRRC